MTDNRSGTHQTADPDPDLKARPATARGPVAANLLVVYVVWGSTYLAIRVMVTTIPPLLGTGLRFLLAGAVLLLGCLLVRGRSSLRMAEVRGSAIVGLLTLGVAFGLLGVAEQTVPSGVSALVIASVPLWGIVLRLGCRERVSAGAVIALVVGFAGVAVLVVPLGIGGDVAVLGLVALLGAALAEGLGTFLTPRVGTPSDPFLSAALQMLWAGAALTAAAPIAGESVHVTGWSMNSLLALLYLAGPGSIVAYAALVWLLTHTANSLATTYAYVNPVIALVLGWAVLDEPVGLSTLIGSVLVVASVVLVWRTDRSPTQPTTETSDSRGRREAGPAPGRNASGG